MSYLHQRFPLFVSIAATAIVFSSTVHAIAAEPDQSILQTLRTAHPRLMWDDKGIAAVKDAIAHDPLAKRWEQLLIKQADAMLNQPPVVHELIGPRLLDKSRTALDRISTLSALYRLTGDARYADRAKKEMMTVTAFADWNPPHFLDVAEMTTAVAIGYDWLFDYLSADERTTIRKAVISMGLKPGLDVYSKKNGWHTSNYNWNQVCNGGMTVGALAIADEEPALAAKIIEAGRKSIPLAMASFTPDGGWAEGPSYWSYATKYNVFYLAAIQTALGTDFGLDKTKGFSEAGKFRIQLLGSSGEVFNFADGGSANGTAPQMFWLARTFNRPAYDAAERIDAATKPGIFDLIWFNPSFSNAEASQALNQQPASQWFKGVQVAFLRAGDGTDGSQRRGPGVTFVGFKGGDNKANHSHLDLGTFVMDMLGRRWAISMGPDDYNLPGYFGKQRWDYYRLRTEGQNTLTFDNQNQELDARSPIIAFDGSREHPYAIADLTQAYRHSAEKVLRGIAIEPSGGVLVQDEIQASQPAKITWHFHTDATVTVSGDTAVLTQPDVGRAGKLTLTARILSPAGARFDLLSINPKPPQRPAPHTRDLTIQLAPSPETVRIAVLFSPRQAEAPGPQIRPLSEWLAK